VAALEHRLERGLGQLLNATTLGDEVALELIDARDEAFGRGRHAEGYAGSQDGGLRSRLRFESEASGLTNHRDSLPRTLARVLSGV
jgi:hypothetical protein